MVVDERAPLYFIGRDEVYPPMLFLVSDQDMFGRLEQIHLTVKTLEHFGHKDNVYLWEQHGRHCEYTETFHENGEIDMAAAMRLYMENGVDVPIRVDHVPTMAGEDNSQPSYGMNGTLFGVGYLKGMMDALGIEY